MKELLEIDVRLLVLRYGKQRVLEVLARLLDETPEGLDQRLNALEQRPKANRTKKSKPSLMEVVSSECREHPDIVEPLRALVIAFENRTFLPNLRDVQRFLDRFGGVHRNLKSRKDAGPVLVRALSKLGRDELLGFREREVAPRESDYSLLSRAIMGNPTKRHDQE